MKSRIFLLIAIVSVAGMLAISGCHREDDEESWGGNVRISRATGELAGHGYVDLGLPSGTLWATCNVGADSPQEYGDYFAWGETEAKGNYDKYTYKYYKYDYNYYSYSDDTGPFRLTKYCPRYEAEYDGYNNFYDDLTTLEPSDDAATVNWGNDHDWCYLPVTLYGAEYVYIDSEYGAEYANMDLGLHIVFVDLRSNRQYNLPENNIQRATLWMENGAVKCNIVSDLPQNPDLM